jgi:hypothetical protein
MRLPNWHRALAAKFAGAEKRAFSWGRFDCALFACDCIHAQTGVDPGAAFRGRYATEQEAAALIGNNLGTTAASVAAQFKLAEIGAGHGHRGDLVLVDNKTAQGALAIVDFTGMYAVCPASQGLLRVRRHRWKRVWRV